MYLLTVLQNENKLLNVVFYPSMYIISPLLPLHFHPLAKDPAFKSFFSTSRLKYFCMVKRDNNCFYTSFVYAFFKLIKTMSNEEKKSLIDKLYLYKDAVLKFNGSTLVFDDFMENFLLELDETRPDHIVDTETNCESQDYNSILESYNTGDDQSYYNYLIAFIKLLISTYLKMNKDEFEAAVKNVFDYCKTNVDVFDVDAGDVEISAVSRIFEVKICVTYGVENYDIMWGEGENKIEILYTPGHFEPVFENK